MPLPVYGKGVGVGVGSGVGSGFGSGVETAVGGGSSTGFGVGIAAIRSSSSRCSSASTAALSRPGRAANHTPSKSASTIPTMIRAVVGQCRLEAGAGCSAFCAARWRRLRFCDILLLSTKTAHHKAVAGGFVLFIPAFQGRDCPRSHPRQPDRKDSPHPRNRPGNPRPHQIRRAERLAVLAYRS